MVSKHPTNALTTPPTPPTKTKKEEEEVEVIVQHA